MLKDHKKRQSLYLNTSKESGQKDFELIVRQHTDKELINKAKEYFICDSDKLEYPSKSYAVAIIYSYLLKKYFSIEINDSLSDPDLFQGTDKYFKPYSENSGHIYKEVIKYLEKEKLTLFEESSIFQVKSSVQYFKDEFFIQHQSFDDILKSEFSS